MCKIGFTLAEILITLGIIGVVAALTAPSLVQNAGNAKVGPSLAKFVNTWETACQTLLAEEEATRLSSIITSKNYQKDLPEVLSKYIHMAQTGQEFYAIRPDGKNQGFNNTIGHDTTNDSNFYGKAWQLADGSTFAVVNEPNGKTNTKSRGAYKGSVGTIRYDINGFGGNNKIGYEVFFFIIDDTGKLIPYGSEKDRWLASDWRTNDANLKCSIGKDAIGSTGQYVNAAWACTGSIFDNNMKVTYK